MTPDTAIRCQQLSKQYGDVHALKPLDLQIARGTIFGFLGRNGAGKTTTIRLLTGLTQPTTGAAWVTGIETTGANNQARAAFGYLPQEPAFYTWMTAREYLDYVARLFQLEKTGRAKRVLEMLAVVGLETAVDRKIGGFSGGMKQRLGIAQALIHQPPVLFLDEPTSALDPAGRHELLSLIEGLRGQVTVFLSSHILNDVERVCDTVGIIHEGQLLLVTGRDDLLAQYASNVIVLRVERENVARLEPFGQVLRAQAWVAGVVQMENELQVTVADMEAGKRAVLPLVVAHDLVLTRYEWKRPSLEEVFLTLSREA
ncbi:MAG: ABC transporter ATP-binding protein [Ardenticatenaceae bacterium]|nr:ABC transporter ATP-binding protein [Ardenticatenaceae bacterium]